MPREKSKATERFFSGPLHWSGYAERKAARALQLPGQYLLPTFEQWEAGFCREESPENEIGLWEMIDAAFRDYFSSARINA